MHRRLTVETLEQRAMLSIGPLFLQQAKLHSPNGTVQAVSISGNTMVVGSPLATVNGNSDQGAAFVFTKSGSTWTETAEAHRGRWRGEGPFRCLGFDQRGHGGGRGVQPHGQRQH